MSKILLSPPSLLYINKRVTDILGYSENDIIEMGGHFFNAIRDDEDKTLYNDLINHFKSGEDIIELQYWIKHKNEGDKYFKSRAMVFKYDEQGKPLEILGIAEDISVQQEAIQRLKHHESLLSDSEKTLKYGSWEWNVPKNEVVWSDGMLNIFGYEQSAKIVDVNFFMDHIHPEDKDDVAKYTEEFLKTGKNYDKDYRIITNSGEVRVLNGKTKVIEGSLDNPIRVIGSTADVTDLRKSNQKLIESEALLAEAEIMLDYGSWEWDLEHDELVWSEGLWRIFGYEPNSFKMDFGKYLELIDERDLMNVKIAINEAYEKRKPYEIEHRFIRQDGEERILSGKGRPIIDKNNKVTKLIGSTADVTNLRKMQENLESKINALNQSNTDLEQFAYVASHDLQEPLRKITAFGERLQSKYGHAVGDEGKLFIERMISASHRMKLLIENLLNFSRVTRQNQDFKSTDLNETIKSVINDLDVKIEEKAALVKYDSLPVIDAIPSQLGQLFMNLISNAIKFGKKEEKIIIEIKQNKISQQEKRDLQLESTKDYTKITFEDNGIGFEQEYAERIFIIFQRLQGRSEGGSGIGLAICKKIVENHSGKIFAQSNINEGSIFTVILPYKQVPVKKYLVKD